MKLGAPLFERVQAAARAVSEQLELDTPTLPWCSARAWAAWPIA